MTWYKEHLKRAKRLTNHFTSLRFRWVRANVGFGKNTQPSENHGPRLGYVHPRGQGRPRRQTWGSTGEKTGFHARANVQPKTPLWRPRSPNRGKIISKSLPHSRRANLGYCGHLPCGHKTSQFSILRVVVKKHWALLLLRRLVFRVPSYEDSILKACRSSIKRTIQALPLP